MPYTTCVRTSGHAGGGFDCTMVAKFLPILFVALLASSVLAAPNPLGGRAFRVKESVLPPHGWTKRTHAPEDHIIELRIALPQLNFPALEKHLYEVSDPYHARYGQHLSKEEVEALVAPRPESIASVDNWLLSHGINVNDVIRTPAKDWVTVRVPVAVAETMLSTVSAK